MSGRSGTGRTRVLVVTGDVLGAKMAGPAIRAWEMAVDNWALVFSNSWILRCFWRKA